MPAISIKQAILACCPEVLRPTLARIETSEIGCRLAKGTFWSMAGAVISRSPMLGAFVLVARMICRTGFGKLEIVRSAAGMFGIFACFGLGLPTSRYVAESSPEHHWSCKERL